MIKRIHVNQHHIKHNRIKQNTEKPVLTCKTSRGNYKGDRVVINGASELVYRPEKPLSCGAVVWIETIAEVNVIMGDDTVTLT